MRIKAIRGKQGIGMEVKDATYVAAAGWGKYRWWRYLLGLMIILFAWMVLANVASEIVALALGGKEGVAALTRLDYAAFGPVWGFVVVMAGFPVFLAIAYKVFKARHNGDNNLNTKTTPIQNASSVLLKMEAAINAHDIDTFMNCFAPDFVGEHPVHPERNLIGAAQVRKNWTAQTTYSRKVINKIITALGCIFVTLFVVFLPATTTAQTRPAMIAPQTQPEQNRRERGTQVINKLTGGAGQPVLNALRQDFPFLADAIVDYSLGEVWSRQGLDNRTRDNRKITRR